MQGSFFPNVTCNRKAAEKYRGSLEFPAKLPASNDQRSTSGFTSFEMRSFFFQDPQNNFADVLLMRFKAVTAALDAIKRHVRSGERQGLNRF